MVEASIHIAAPPATVFRYFTESEAMVEWMGQFADLDARPGGRFEMSIHGTVVRGEFLEVEPPRRLVFSWGHVGSDELPPRASRVEVEFEDRDGGTFVRLMHHGLPAGARTDGHRRGWAMFLGRLQAVHAP